MPKMNKGRRRPFEFFLNNKGMDENDGVLRRSPLSADLIQNMHIKRTGEFTSHGVGYTAHTSQLESGSGS